MLAVLCDIPSDYFFFMTILSFCWGFGGNVVFRVIFYSFIFTILGYSVVEVSLFLPVFTDEALLEDRRERSSFENLGLYLNNASSFSS